MSNAAGTTVHMTPAAAPIRIDGDWSGEDAADRDQDRQVKAPYTFTSKLFVRVIGQYDATTRDPSL